MHSLPLLQRIALLATAALAFVASGFSQGVTTSSLTGFVTDRNAQPVIGANVTVVHEPSGTRAEVLTRASGQYTLSGLRPGGPYSVTVAGPAGTETRRDIYLELGDGEAVNFVLGAPEVVKMAAFKVQGERETTFSATKIGTGSSFNSAEVEQLPSVRRNVQDIAQLDSRVTVMNLSSNGEMSAQGQNYRYNSFLVDNVQTNDPFGLNANGFAALRSPIPFEAIQALTVELNPYDVRRAGFTGALINAVTKSGTNQFHGMVYGEYTDQNMRAKNPVNQNREVFRERTLGGTFGGPIIPGKLFFFLSYDDFLRTTPPPTLNLTLNPAQVAQIVARAQTFNYDPGTFTGAKNESRQRTWIGKLDWNISSAHRLSLSYRRLRGNEPVFQFFGGNNTSFSNYWHDTERQTDSYTAQLFSNWTPALRTEASFSYNKYDGSAHNRGAVFPSVFIQGITAVRVADGVTVQTGTVDLGQDSTYQQNTLKTETRNAVVSAEYSIGSHTLLAGADVQRTRIADDFINNAGGSYTFRAVADWLTGTNASFTQTGLAPGKTRQDAYGDFTYNTLGLYAQDVWKPGPQLSVTAGVRLDIPYVSDQPTQIPTTTSYSEASFRAAFGQASNGTNDGNYTFGPRVGFNYKFDTERKTQVRGGLGLFQGTNPAVWLSNAYQNRGVTNQVSLTNATFNPSPNPTVSAPVVAAINLTDPGFHSPAVWKANLGVDHALPFAGLTLTVEVDLLRNRYGVLLRDLNLKPLGTLPDGRIRYAGPIVATSTGNGRGGNSNSYSNTANYQAAGFADVFELTNTSKGGGSDETVRLARPFKNDWSASLAWTHSSFKDVSPMTAIGNAISFYNTRAVFNSNENAASTSNYNIPERLVGQFTRRFNLIRKAPTTVTLLWQGRTGRPYSWVFAGDANGDGFTFNDLLYVPSGPADPRVRWNSTTERDNFFAFVNSSPLSAYRGTVVPRNSEHALWVNTVDLKLTQEIPVFRELRAEVFANLLNAGNLINRRWGLLQELPFAYKRGVAGATFDAATNQYVYTFTPSSLDPVPTTADGTSGNSRWQVQVGLRVRF